MPFVLPEDGTIQSISIYHDGGSGGLLMGVYSDVNGLPDQRLAVTEETEIHSYEGWQTVILTTPVDVNEGQTIWLAWVFESNPGIRYESGTPGRAHSSQTWAGGMPSSFGSSTTDNYIYSIYADYIPDAQDEDPELIGNPYMFTGRRFDLETGLYYYRARYYDPNTGRFLQTDPIGYADGINWYNYCGNNPLNCIDPGGLWYQHYVFPISYFSGATNGNVKSLVQGFLNEIHFYDLFSHVELIDAKIDGEIIDVNFYAPDGPLSFMPDFDVVGMPIHEGPGDYYSFVKNVSVLTLGGVGLLNDIKLSEIIELSLARVDGWDFGSVIGYYDCRTLYYRCDTPFWFDVECLNPSFGVRFWNFRGTEYSFADINFLLTGHAWKKAGFSWEFTYGIYYLRENAQEFSFSNFLDILTCGAPWRQPGWIPMFGDGDYFRSTSEVQKGAIWLAYGYYGL